MEAHNFESILSAVDSAWMRMLDETTMRLRVIGSLEQGHRVNTRMHYVYRNAWHARIYRSFVFTESREHTVAYVRTAVDNLSAVVSSVVHGRFAIPDDVLAALLEVVLAAVGGVGKLQLTYADDIASVSALSSLATRLGLLHACLAARAREKKPAPAP
jgi:hypothetical protein